MAIAAFPTNHHDQHGATKRRERIVLLRLYLLIAIADQPQISALQTV